MLKKRGIRGYQNIDRIKHFLKENAAKDIEDCGFDFNNPDYIYYANKDYCCDCIEISKAEFFDLEPAKCFDDLTIGDQVILNTFCFPHINRNKTLTIINIEPVDKFNIKFTFSNDQSHTVHKYFYKVTTGDTYMSNTLSIQ